MGDKRFKDPVYGYLEIDEELIVQVVDTAFFHHLLFQTSSSILKYLSWHACFMTWGMPHFPIQEKNFIWKKVKGINFIKG